MPSVLNTASEATRRRGGGGWPRRDERDAPKSSKNVTPHAKLQLRKVHELQLRKVHDGHRTAISLNFLCVLRETEVGRIDLGPASTERLKCT